MLLCALAAAGCISYTEMANLRSRIQEAGYTEVSIVHNIRNGFDTVAVIANKPQTDDGETIARLIWHTYPAEVDRIVVTVNGITRSATKDEAENAFGPRRIQPDSSGGAGLSTALATVLIVGLLLVGGLIILFIIIRRRRRTVPPPHDSQGPYYYKP